MAISPYIADIRRRIGTDLLLVPTVAVLPRDEAGRILLVRQIDSGKWTTIGGTIEAGDPAPDGDETSAVEWFDTDDLEDLDLNELNRALLAYALGEL